MKESQRIRILHRLEGAGEEGVHSFTLATQIGLRASARVEELRKQGYQIDSPRAKMGNATGVRYILRNV